MSNARAGVVVTQSRFFHPNHRSMCRFLAGVFRVAAGVLHSLGSFLDEQVGQLRNVSLLFSAWDLFPFFPSKYNKKPVNKSQKRDLSLKYEPWHGTTFDSEATSHLWRPEVCSTSSSRRSLNAYKNRVYLSTVRTAYLLS